MTDDAYLGKACCYIPRRLFVLLVSVACILYGVIQTAYYLYESVYRSNELTPIHCTRSSCPETFTCAGMQRVTFEVQQAYFVVGCVVFGYIGVVGSLTGDYGRLAAFAFFSGLAAAVLCGICFSDFAFDLVCDQYSQNLIEVVFFQLNPPNYPVHRYVKTELRQMKTYPTKAVDKRTAIGHIRVEYSSWMFLYVSLWLYIMHNTLTLAQFEAAGKFGMGPNYSIRNWRNGVFRKYALMDAFDQSKAMFAESCEDVGWRMDDRWRAEHQPLGMSRWRPPAPPKQEAYGAVMPPYESRQDMLL